MKNQEILDKIAIMDAKLDRIINLIMPLNEEKPKPKTKAELRQEKKETVKEEFRRKLHERTTIADPSAHDKIREKFLWKGSKKRR